MVEWSLLQLEFREEMFQDKILLSPMAAYVKLQYMNMQYETYDVMKNFMIYALGFLSFLLFLEIVSTMVVYAKMQHMAIVYKSYDAIKIS